VIWRIGAPLAVGFLLMEVAGRFQPGFPIIYTLICRLAVVIFARHRVILAMINSLGDAGHGDVLRMARSYDTGCGTGRPLAVRGQEMIGALVRSLSPCRGVNGHGVHLSRNSTRFHGPNMPDGRMRRRRTCGTVCSPGLCGQVSNSISPNSGQSSRREASRVIEQRDGPYGMGHDDARVGSQAFPRPEARIDAGVTKLTDTGRPKF
jgi:hypothetical protein